MGPLPARDDLLVGDRVDLVGYGKGVCAFGGCVYEARYRRSFDDGQ